MYEIKKLKHNNLPIIIIFFFLMVAPLADDLPLTPHHEGIYLFPLSLSQSFGKTIVYKRKSIFLNS